MGFIGFDEAWGLPDAFGIQYRGANNWRMGHRGILRDVPSAPIFHLSPDTLARTKQLPQPIIAGP